MPRRNSLDDATARHLLDASIEKLKVVLEKQLVPFCKRKHICTMRQITFSDVIEFRKSWADNPLAASKKIRASEVLLAFLRKGGLVREHHGRIEGTEGHAKMK